MKTWCDGRYRYVCDVCGQIRSDGRKGTACTITHFLFIVCVGQLFKGRTFVAYIRSHHTVVQLPVQVVLVQKNAELCMDRLNSGCVCYKLLILIAVQVLCFSQANHDKKAI
jgi:hypothetical protein